MWKSAIANGGVDGATLRAVHERETAEEGRHSGRGEDLERLYRGEDDVSEQRILAPFRGMVGRYERSGERRHSAQAERVPCPRTN